MPPPSPDPLLAALRGATRERHARIESLLRLDAPMPLARYGAILRGFHEFLARWEAAVHAALPERLQGWFDARRRGSFTAQDLAWLGTPSSPPRAEDARRAVDGLPLAGLAALFGSMYVIEGSALGGQVIAPRLERELGLAPGRGASYFHGYGEHTGAMWREFRQRAAAEVGCGAEAVDAACRAAERTFDALLDTFAPIAA
jgi:heme oxygenase